MRAVVGVSSSADGRARRVPATRPRATGDPATLKARFLENLGAAGASHAVVTGRRGVAGALAEHLSTAGLPLHAVVSEDLLLEGCDLAAQCRLRQPQGARGCRQGAFLGRDEKGASAVPIEFDRSPVHTNTYIYNSSNGVSSLLLHGYDARQ